MDNDHKKLLMNLVLSVRAEEAVKAAEKKAAAAAAAEKILGPRPPAPERAPDPLALLEKELQAIDQAGLEEEARARREYLALLARLAPARTGPAPAPDAHALAVGPAEGPPSPTEVIALLKAASKSRDELRRDLVTWAQLRDQADLAATLPALKEAEQRAEAALAEIQAAFAEVEAEWAGEVEARRRQKEEAGFARARAAEALHVIQVAQGTHRRIGAVRFPRILDPALASAEEIEAEAEAKKRRAEIEESGQRLGLLEEVFFPAPPSQRDPNVTEYEGCSWTYAPQGKP